MTVNGFRGKLSKYVRRYLRYIVVRRLFLEDAIDRILLFFLAHAHERSCDPTLSEVETICGRERERGGERER